MRVRLSLVLWKDFGKGGKSGAPERVREYAPRNVLLSFIAYVFVFLANLLHAVACIVNLSLGIGIMCCILNMHICFLGGVVLDLLVWTCFVCIDSSWGVVVLVRLGWGQWSLLARKENICVFILN